MKRTALKPIAQKAVKGMKWVAYTMDTAPKFFKTLKEVSIELGYCDDILHRVSTGYESVSSSGRTLMVDRLSSVNNDHIEDMVDCMINGDQ
jgi:hypothetical protein|tara:strand:- start:9 stop:281 length:273 start_codon:yes stop_codon:yes gene_type:complete